MKQTTMYLSQDDLDYISGIALEKCISRVAALSLIINEHRDGAVCISRNKDKCNTLN